MRLAYLVSQYPAFNHTFILREIRYLRAQGFDIDVVSIRRPDRQPAALIAEEREELTRTRAVLASSAISIIGAHLKVLLANPLGWLGGLILALRMSRGSLPAIFRHILYFAEAVVAGDWMRSAGYTRFHTHFSSTVGFLAARVFPLKMSMTIHGPEEFNDVEAFFMSEKVAACDLVIAISSFARSQILRTVAPSEWEKVIVCRLGVDGAVFDPRPYPVDGIPEILCVGRLAPVKAQQILIQALAILRDRGIKARLRLVGDGPDRRMLERSATQMRLAEDVIFEGWRNQDEVRESYQRATIFAMASFAEGIPVVLMEAMAKEIPCVATRIMGIPELIEDNISGLLVPPADPDALAGALERLLKDTTLQTTLGRAGRPRVLHHFDLRTNTAELGAIFRGQVARKHFNHEQAQGEQSRLVHQK